MSHLDELDEFEAELELQLKREYTAVFPLFRYCVLTQDATYLCNKLDLKVVPQASYPFFHAQMEDVWVWDKNRPTRIIPRRGLHVRRRDGRGAARRGRRAASHRRGARGAAGGHPPLGRRGLVLSSSRSSRPHASVAVRSRACCSQSTSATPDRARPLRGRELAEHWRVATDRTRTGDELAVLLGGLLDPDSVDGICLSTTVPSILREWQGLAERWAHAPLLVVGPGVKTGSRSATTTRGRWGRTGS
jgi:hypothetical protein